MQRIILLVLVFFFNIETSYAKDSSILKTDDFVPHELLVKFKSPNIKSSLLRYSAIDKKTFKASGAKLLEFPSVVDLEKMRKELSLNPNVEYVELNSIYKLLSEPNDAKYSQLYGMTSMSMPAAWESNIGSKDIVVGVIDTGIDYNHADLKDNYWNNPGEMGIDADGNDKSTNGLDDDDNGYVDDFRGWDFINADNDPMDGHGHGTHCAGSIGAVGNNGIGVVGVNWQVSLVGLKIFSDSGRTTAEAITEAIEYSTRIGVDVTNNSWGGGSASETIRAAIEEANEAKILFIAAAGNSSANNDTGSFYPANYEIPNIISVAAIDSLDRLARFSNYGKMKVHVAAPGVNILSTKPGGGYQNMSGTSMAAPHVTGLAAFIMAKFPDESMARIKRRIVYTGDNVLALSEKLISGKKANGFNSLQVDEAAPAAVAQITVLDSLMSSVKIAFGNTGDDGFEGEASEYDVRISTEMINDENWESAKKISMKNRRVVNNETHFELANLDLNYEGYLAIKAYDDLGNVSSLSKVISIEALKVTILSENQADSLEGVVVEGAWGLESIEEGNTAFSDSPDGKYSDNENSSLTLAPLPVVSEKTFLRLKMDYDLENKYDFGYVEVSVDEVSWVEVAKYNGNSKGIVTPVVDISEVVAGAESYQVRFRITSDRSQTKEGWRIDSMTVLGEL